MFLAAHPGAHALVFLPISLRQSPLPTSWLTCWISVWILLHFYAPLLRGCKFTSTWFCRELVAPGPDGMRQETLWRSLSWWSTHQRTVGAAVRRSTSYVQIGVCWKAEAPVNWEEKHFLLETASKPQPSCGSSLGTIPVGSSPRHQADITFTLSNSSPSLSRALLLITGQPLPLSLSLSGIIFLCQRFLLIATAGRHSQVERPKTSPAGAAMEGTELSSHTARQQHRVILGGEMVKPW